MRSSLENENSTAGWPVYARRIAACVILIYLGIVVLAPMTIPAGAPHLTTPIANQLAPIHQALYLGHGYRFFGPDPGESHSVVYRITQADGSSVEGHFPDRNQTSPRLLYHRWFMLSETLFREGNSVPNVAQLQAMNRQYATNMKQYEDAGRKRLKAQLAEEQRIEQQRIALAKKRRDILIRSIARVLIERHEGTTITLSVQSRRLPTPEEVLDGYTLDDEEFISRFEIGTYTRQQIDDDTPLPVNGESNVLEPFPAPLGGTP